MKKNLKNKKLVEETSNFKEELLSKIKEYKERTKNTDNKFNYPDSSISERSENLEDFGIEILDLENFIKKNQITDGNKFLNKLEESINSNSNSFILPNIEGREEKFKIEFYEKVSDITDPVDDMVILKIESQNNCLKLKQMRYYILDNDISDIMCYGNGQEYNISYNYEEKGGIRNNSSNKSSNTAKPDPNSKNKIKTEENTLDKYFCGPKQPENPNEMNKEINRVVETVNDAVNKAKPEGMKMDDGKNNSKELSNEKDAKKSNEVSSHNSEDCPGKSQFLQIHGNDNEKRLSKVCNSSPIAQISDKSNWLQEKSTPNFKEIRRYVIGGDTNPYSQLNRNQDILIPDSSPEDIKVIPFNMRKENGELHPNLPLNEFTSPKDLIKKQESPGFGSNGMEKMMLRGLNLYSNDKKAVEQGNSKFFAIGNQDLSNGTSVPIFADQGEGAKNYTAPGNYFQSDISDFDKNSEKESIYIVNNHPINKSTNGLNPNQLVSDSQLDSNKENILIQISIPEDKNIEILLRKNVENGVPANQNIETEEIKYEKPDEPKKGIVKVLVEKFENSTTSESQMN